MAKVLIELVWLEQRVPSVLVVLGQPTTRSVRRAVAVPPRHVGKPPHRGKRHEHPGGTEA